MLSCLYLWSGTPSCKIPSIRDSLVIRFPLMAHAIKMEISRTKTQQFHIFQVLSLVNAEKLDRTISFYVEGRRSGTA